MTKKKVLIIIDMQNDFVRGPLGSQEAVDIIPNILERIYEYNDNNDYTIATKDTHFDDYDTTLEGKKLPIPHCKINTEGWEIINELKKFPNQTILKWTFGVENWPWNLHDCLINTCGETIDEIELCGVCTDICVISNALILRRDFPDMKITVYDNCCAGTTPEKHTAALKVMESCQIDVIWKED